MKLTAVRANKRTTGFITDAFGILSRASRSCRGAADAAAAAPAAPAAPAAAVGDDCGWCDDIFVIKQVITSIFVLISNMAAGQSALHVHV